MEAEDCKDGSEVKGNCVPFVCRSQSIDISLQSCGAGRARVTYLSHVCLSHWSGAFLMPLLERDTV
jgi:hypothetical protein